MSNKRRINVDRTFRWAILINSKIVSLVGMDLKLTCVNPRMEHCSLEFTTSGNEVIAQFPTSVQRYLGIYHLTLWANYGKVGQSALDACDAIELVPTTCDASDYPDIDSDDIIVADGNLKMGITGPKGDNGVSVTHKWVGTKLELTSASGTTVTDLRGPKGEDGTDVTHSFEGTKLIMTSASGTTEVDLKGKQGDRGFPGTVNWPRFQTDPRTGHLFGSADNPESCKTLEISKNGHLTHWS